MWDPSAKSGQTSKDQPGKNLKGQGTHLAPCDCRSRTQAGAVACSLRKEVRETAFGEMHTW